MEAYKNDFIFIQIILISAWNSILQICFSKIELVINGLPMHGTAIFGFTLRDCHLYWIYVFYSFILFLGKEFPKGETMNTANVVYSWYIDVSPINTILSFSSLGLIAIILT